MLGKKDEILAELYTAREEKKEYEINKDTELSNLGKEESNLQLEIITAMDKGEYEKAKDLLDKCKDIQNKSKSLENDDSNKLYGINAKIFHIKEDYDKIKNQIREAEDLVKYIEKSFEGDCKEVLESKEQRLAEIKNNTMFDKIKGFLSKSVLNKINSASKFKRDYLDPTRKNIKDFAESVPKKASNLKEQFSNRITNILGKGKQIATNVKDKVIETAQNTRDFAEAKIQDMGEGIRTAQDYISGKTVEAIDAAYEFGVNTRSKVRNSAISKLESAANKLNEKAQELRAKENEINKKNNNKNSQEHGLF